MIVSNNILSYQILYCQLNKINLPRRTIRSRNLVAFFQTYISTELDANNNECD